MWLFQVISVVFLFAVSMARQTIPLEGFATKTQISEDISGSIVSGLEDEAEVQESTPQNPLGGTESLIEDGLNHLEDESREFTIIMTEDPKTNQKGSLIHENEDGLVNNFNQFMINALKPKNVTAKTPYNRSLNREKRNSGALVSDQFFMGYFNDFRSSEGGPSLYMAPNRTSASIDYTFAPIILAFLTVFIAFVTVLPGIRKKRITSLCIVSLSLLSGLTILLGKYGSSWHCGKGEITTAYKAFSNQRIHAQMEINIGLHHMNVTLQVLDKGDQPMDIYFNEKFSWDTPKDLRRQYHEALIKGLPYPILEVAEYLAISTETIKWGFDYRQAGYYTNISLTVALISWLLMNHMLMHIPRYGCYLMFTTGLLQCVSAFLYVKLMPTHPMLIRFENTTISFHLGWCFWMVQMIGFLQAAIGFAISLIDLMFPHTFSTILDVDFDTPFDRHILIQDSEDTGKRARAAKLQNIRKSIIARVTSGTQILKRMTTKKQSSDTEKHTPAAFYNQGLDLTTEKKVNFIGDLPENSKDIEYDEDHNSKKQSPETAASTSDPESELENEFEEKNAKVIKMHQTDNRGSIILKSKKESEPADIVWEEKFIMDIF